MSIFRSTLQSLAEMRIREARVLLSAKEYAGAYHLAGFAVECALKAKIAKESKRYEFPDAVRARNCWSHDLERLLEQAGLKAALTAAMASDPQLKLNWVYVSNWDVEVRYRATISKSDAVEICDAIDHPTSGVLTWIRGYW